MLYLTLLHGYQIIMQLHAYFSICWSACLLLCVCVHVCACTRVCVPQICMFMYVCVECVYAFGEDNLRKQIKEPMEFSA